jgi:hypothetical protein
MPSDCVEKHQLAGLDERARGFNRVVEVERAGTIYRATMRYEQTRMTVDGHETETAALHGLVRHLHAHGYAQLRSQLSFRGADYLGSREPWIEYPDPTQPTNLFARLFGWLRRGQATS